jgi:hypothetical protein
VFAVLEDRAYVNFAYAWYEEPNASTIVNLVMQLVRDTPRDEIYGIRKRMSDTLVQNLNDMQIDPVGYHFRRLVQKEFEIQKANAATPSKRKLVKNIVKQQKAQDEAEADVDDWIYSEIEKYQLDEGGATPDAGDLDDGEVERDVEHLWGEI